MREIKELYLKVKNQLILKDLESITPRDLIIYHTEASEPTGNAWYAKVLDTERNELVFIDLTLLLTITTLQRDCLLKIASCNPDWTEEDPLPDISQITWELLGECITDKMVMGYTFTVPWFNNPDVSIRFAQVLHTQDFTCSYCMWKTPEDRNINFRRWQLLDLAITKLSDKNPIRLENCLLSVNGCFSRPFMFNEELIMPDGAYFMHNSSWSKLPSVTLIDFEGLGGVSTIPFSECTFAPREPYLENHKKTKIVSFTKEVEYLVPEGIDLTKKTVWMVLGHSLYMSSSEVRVTGPRTVVFHPCKLALDTALIKSAYNKSKYLMDTDVVRTEDMVTTYLNEIANSESHFGAFFIVINTDNLYIQERPFFRYAHDRMFFGQAQSTGLLWDKKTHSFFDHTSIYYDTGTDQYSMETNDLAYLSQCEAGGHYHATDQLHPYFRNMVQEGDPEMVILNIARSLPIAIGE